MADRQIEFSCGHCGAPLKADSRMAGRMGTCPECNRPVTVPPASEAERPDPNKTKGVKQNRCDRST